MEAFQPLRSIEHVPPVERKGPEERFWETFDEKTRIRLTGAVQGVHFSPLGSNQVAVTAESRVTILKSSTGDLIKSFPRTDTVAYAGRYRTDGKLLVAGTESGLVHLYNAHSRSILRTFSGHKR